MSKLQITESFNEDGQRKQFFKAKKTEWISNLVYLDGKPFSFKGREYLIPIYNSNAPKKLLKFSRQSEKSTMLANEIIAESVITPYTKTIYVSPSHLQSRQFSNGKLKPWIEDSPIISKYFIDTSTTAQVFERGFKNGSMCWIRAAFLSPDRARGLSGTALFLDELQDLLTSNIPIIEECLSHCADPHEIMSGTPKTLENPMEEYWGISSQCEWLVPCTHHYPLYWNFLDERCIGKTGPICNKCGSAIHPSQGKWFAFSKERDVMGYRISQIMVPWYQDPRKWKELIFKFENYSKGVFYNEVLGISYDNASKPITQSDLVACCSSTHPVRGVPDYWTRKVEVFAGIDWGEGTDGSERGNKGKLKNASYTILTLGTYLSPNVFHYFYYKRFEGKEAHPSHCIQDIISTMRAFNITCAGVDWGHGWGVNEQLEEAFGQKKIVKFQHVGNQRERKKFDDIGVKYQLSRTEVMTDFFTSIKKQEIVWPAWEHMKKYLVDIEHVYAEYSEGSKSMKYDHKTSEPDDACHASIMCREAADNYYGKKR